MAIPRPGSLRVGVVSHVDQGAEQEVMEPTLTRSEEAIGLTHG
jgi:hypothetical protein